MTIKQKAFCKHYILSDFNAAEAARRAGYSERTARTQGQTLLTKPDIKARLEKEIKAKLSELDKTGLKLLNSIVHASYFDIRKIVSWDDNSITLVDSKLLDNLDAQMVTEISETKEGIKVKFVSKEKAWDMLAKFSKLIDPERLNSEEDEKKSISKEDQKERLAYLLKKRGQ